MKVKISYDLACCIRTYIAWASTTANLEGKSFAPDITEKVQLLESAIREYERSQK